MAASILRRRVLSCGKGALCTSQNLSYLARPKPAVHPRRLFTSKTNGYHLPPPPLPQPSIVIDSEDEFWRKIPLWKDVPREKFLSWQWGVNNVVEAKLGRDGVLQPNNVLDFLDNVLPAEVPRHNRIGGTQSRDELMVDIISGMRESTMSVRVMPYPLSRMDWKDPANDPVFQQFIPMKSIMMPDHHALRLDSLDEKKDKPVAALVHRYPDKALLLPTAVCPTYCIYCTRSYGVGGDTELVTKENFRVTRDRLNEAFDYIESQEGLHDIVVSGGDAFYIMPHLLEWIGDRLIGMKNVERFRIASKGLAVAPHRFIDKDDQWTETLIRISDKARKAGKHMALHTHFNHPNEISWITELASLKLTQAGVTVRNQTVLLRGINDNVDTISTLVKKLARLNIQPYYVYQCDMVKKIEHLRTPLQTILDIESAIQGIVAGFNIPKFVVDLPEGGGKRPAALYESYDRTTGISTYTQPALTRNGKEGKVYQYYDPLDSLLPSS
ncbi:kama family protein [Daldinia caldariorum]|uniref:kama family protein n=1 Tax=Daldinia caldariorum TaxID=326644 RepID=UPI002008873F|nr:kama family protein [Daldinia caldariorum]KAI1467354.1 kama family protein [Daldinia caldariorum]